MMLLRLTVLIGTPIILLIVCVNLLPRLMTHWKWRRVDMQALDRQLAAEGWRTPVERERIANALKERTRADFGLVGYLLFLGVLVSLIFAHNYMRG